MKQCSTSGISRPSNLVLWMQENMFVWQRPQQISHHDLKKKKKVFSVKRKIIIPATCES